MDRASPFEDVAWSRLTDPSGRRWKPREILALSIDDFCGLYNDYGRRGIEVYGMVAEDAKREEARRLPTPDRSRFDAVDQIVGTLRTAAFALAENLDTLDYLGTVGAGAYLGHWADGENRLRRAAMAWRVDVAGGRTRYRRASDRLRERVTRRVREPRRLRPLSNYGPDPDRARRDGRTLLRCVAALDHLAPSLHRGALAWIADELDANTSLLRPPGTYR